MSERPQETSDTPLCFTPLHPIGWTQRLYLQNPCLLNPSLSIHGQATIVSPPITVTPSHRGAGSPGPSKACLPPRARSRHSPHPAPPLTPMPPWLPNAYRVKPELSAVPPKCLHHLALPPSPISPTPSHLPHLHTPTSGLSTLTLSVPGTLALRSWRA